MGCRGLEVGPASTTSNQRIVEIEEKKGLPGMVIRSGGK